MALHPLVALVALLFLTHVAAADSHSKAIRQAPGNCTFSLNLPESFGTFGDQFQNHQDSYHACITIAPASVPDPFSHLELELEFNLERDYDYLYVWESEGGNLIGSYTGQGHFLIYSGAPELYIEYSTDFVTGSYGFTGSWAYKAGFPPTVREVNLQDCESFPELGAAGTLLSNEAELYQNNVERCWLIDVSASHPSGYVELVIDFFTENFFDLIFVYEDETQETLLTTLSGRGSATITSRDTDLYLLFVSDSSVVRPGFNATWQGMDGTPPAIQVVSTLEDSEAGGGCDCIYPQFTWTALEGSVDDNMDLYDNFFNGCWEIDVTGKADYIELDLDYHTEAGYDFLYVCDEASENAWIEITSFHGIGQVKIASETPRLLLHLITDESVARGGFTGVYRGLDGEPPVERVIEPFRLSPGAVVGIVIALIIVVAVAVAIIIILIRRKRQTKKERHARFQDEPEIELDETIDPNSEPDPKPEGDVSVEVTVS